MIDAQAKIGSVRAAGYRIPTDKPEADGTFKWESTTLIVVRIEAGHTHGLGYTYSDASIVGLIENALRKTIEGRDAHAGVLWFEEPVSSDDLVGMKLLRHRAPPGMEVAAGEYGYTVDYFRRMLQSGAVDVQQADLSRCGGVTGFLQVAALCEAHHIDLSAHCAPALHLHAACAVPRFRHVEWFHDHVLIEARLFEGAPVPKDGEIRPDLSRPGLGLAFKESDAERYRL